VALAELWAKAGREADPEVLTRRVRALDRIVDPRDPLHPTGVQLVQRVGGTVQGPNLVRPHEQFALRAAAFWRQLVDGPSDRDAILRQGRTINSEIDDDAADWLGANEEAVALGERAGSLPESTAVRAVAADLVAHFATQVSVRDGVQERFHGYYRSVALHAIRAWKRRRGLLPKIDLNDSEDAQLPMHIADRAFVATHDLNFIEHFDASGTFQAPWMRTIGELLSQPLPVGDPWGRSARRALGSHIPRDRKRLVQLEEEARAKFRPPGGIGGPV
jgi:hypothetical protein